MHHLARSSPCLLLHSVPPFSLTHTLLLVGFGRLHNPEPHSRQPAQRTPMICFHNVSLTQTMTVSSIVINRRCWILAGTERGGEGWDGKHAKCHLWLILFATQVSRWGTTQGAVIHHHMSKYPQTVYYLDSAGLQYFIQCITHSKGRGGRPDR